MGFHGEGDYMKDVATRFALANSEAELKQGLAKVDAEVGSVDDLVVSEADLAALKSFNATPVKAVSSAPVEVQPGSEPESQQVPPVEPEKKGIQTRWVIFFVVVFLIIRRLVGHHNRKK